MPGQEQQEILIQIAEMRQQMAAVISAVDEVRTSMKDIATHDRTIAELAIYHQQMAKDIATQWNRIDTNSQNIDAIDAKADEWINKGKGAWATLIILGGAIQFAVIAAVTYSFTHLRSVEDANLLMNQRVIVLEQLREGGKK